jgi:hypothetical protein
VGWLGKQWRPQRPHTLCPRRAHLRLETLESRLVPYSVTGNSWPNPQLITISFVPDGTVVGTSNNGLVYSNLFATFNAKFGSPAAWQNAILKGAQLWAQQTNVNFAIVGDDGVSEGAGLYEQGDPLMGDIRISGFTFCSNALAATALPPPANNYSVAGDISFNTAQIWNINGATYDLEAVAMHEFGHALGMGHSTYTSAIMYPNYTGAKRALGSDDVQGIRSIYGGARTPDAYDTGCGDNSFATAANIQSQIGAVSLTAVVNGLNLISTSDVAYYTFTAPAGTSSSSTVTVQSQGLSLLTPAVTVYAADQQTVLGSASGAGQYGTTLTVTVPNISAGQQFYVKVAGADSTQFSTGAYGLTLNFGIGPNPIVLMPNTQVLNGFPQNNGGSTPELPTVDNLPDTSADSFPDDLGAGSNAAPAAAPAPQTVAAAPAAADIARSQPASSGLVSQALSTAAQLAAGRSTSANFTVAPAAQTSPGATVVIANAGAAPTGPGSTLQTAETNLSGGGAGDLGQVPDSGRDSAPATATPLQTAPPAPAPESADVVHTWNQATDACFAGQGWGGASLDVSAASALSASGEVSHETTPGAAIAGLALLLAGSSAVCREQPEERKRRPSPPR